MVTTDMIVLRLKGTIFDTVNHILYSVYFYMYWKRNQTSFNILYILFIML